MQSRRKDKKKNRAQQRIIIRTVLCIFYGEGTTVTVLSEDAPDSTITTLPISGVGVGVGVGSTSCGSTVGITSEAGAGVGVGVGSGV